MVKLTRKSDRRNIVASRRTFFAGCKTYMGRLFFEAQNEAELFIDVLRTNTLASKFKLHEFVVMPDHFHVLLTVDGHTSIERAIQLIKGGYSHAVREQSLRAIWHSGHHEHRIRDLEDFNSQSLYIANNPTRRNYAEYPHIHTNGTYRPNLDPTPLHLME